MEALHWAQKTRSYQPAIRAHPRAAGPRTLSHSITSRLRELPYSQRLDPARRPNASRQGTRGQELSFADFPGTLVAPNLTSDPETGSAGWTDDQIARAIREGVKHDDTILFPAMPYSLHKTLSDEDLASVVVYLRSVPPLRNPLPPTHIITWSAAPPNQWSNRSRALIHRTVSPAGNTWPTLGAAATT